MKRKNVLSKAQTEVWEWKEKAAESLLLLPPEEWLKVIHARTLPAQKAIQQRRAKKSASKVRRASA
jgi:hypothetical protein